MKNLFNISFKERHLVFFKVPKPDFSKDQIKKIKESQFSADQLKFIKEFEKPRKIKVAAASILFKMGYEKRVAGRKYKAQDTYTAAYNFVQNHKKNPKGRLKEIQGWMKHRMPYLKDDSYEQKPMINYMLNVFAKNIDDQIVKFSKLKK